VVTVNGHWGELERKKKFGLEFGIWCLEFPLEENKAAGKISFLASFIFSSS
jgi:hypothetical protein